jgi:hypothetical protein
LRGKEFSEGTHSSLGRPNPRAPDGFPGLFFALEAGPFPAFFFGCSWLSTSSFSEDTLPDSSFPEEALSDAIGASSELSFVFSSSALALQHPTSSRR